MGLDMNERAQDERRMPKRKVGQGMVRAIRDVLVDREPANRMVSRKIEVVLEDSRGGRHRLDGRLLPHAECRRGRTFTRGCR